MNYPLIKNLVKGVAKRFIWPILPSMDKPLSKYNREAKERSQARAKQIAKLKNAGKTFAEIGLQFGISPQRAQQLFSSITASKNVA